MWPSSLSRRARRKARNYGGAAWHEYRDDFVYRTSPLLHVELLNESLRNMEVCDGPRKVYRHGLRAQRGQWLDGSGQQGGASQPVKYSAPTEPADDVPSTRGSNRLHKQAGSYDSWGTRVRGSPLCSVQGAFTVDVPRSRCRSCSCSP